MDKQTSETKESIDKIIRKHVYAATAAGLIPVPFLDFTAVSAIQLNMLRKLSQLYNLPFSEDMIKNLIGVLLGGSAPASAGPILASSLKVIPIIGQSIGALSMPAVAGTSTYAVGQVFNRHFAEGGTFLTFDPEKTKDFYAEMFKKGEDIVENIKKGKDKKD